MHDERFDDCKCAILAKLQETVYVDKSPKGSLDAPILELIDFLNSHPHYVTTSSCSGRIALLRANNIGEGARSAQLDDADEIEGEERGGEGEGSGEVESKGVKWLLVEHSTITYEQLHTTLQSEDATSHQGQLTFKHEPFIMHVQCCGLAEAKRLLQIALSCGYRESGIVLGKKYMVHVRTTAFMLELPLAFGSEMMVSEDYLRYLVKLANEKFVQNQQRTDKFFARLRETLLVCEESEAGDTAESANAVLVAKRNVKAVKIALEKFGQIDKTKRIGPHGEAGSGMMAIPLNREGVLSLSRCQASAAGDGATPPLADGSPEAALRDLLPSGVCLVRADLPPSKLTLVGAGSQTTALEVALGKLLSKLPLPQSRASSMLSEKEEEGGQPRKWEWVGDVLMVPEKAFTADGWSQCDATELWSTVAQVMRAERVARKAIVKDNSMRQSQVQILFASEGARAQGGWVKVKEQGLVYTWDITRVMFSSGNVTEKRRMGQIGCEQNTIVDLYAGIGYYVVPMLVHGGATLIHACEQNPDSIEALRLNLERNGVADRCQVHAGDNQKTAPALESVADRVNLGLIPSSEATWGLAVRCLKTTGGWLHVHANVGTSERDSWLEGLLSAVRQHAQERGVSWDVVCNHVERVKSYAPRIDHVVADIHCVLR
jgi:tRNA wybutosine-synthesizing protein 3